MIKPSRIFREAIKKKIPQFKGWFSSNDRSAFCAAGLFKEWKNLPDWSNYLDVINKTLSKAKHKRFDTFRENDLGMTFEQFAEALEKHGR